jgi:hypothetical protein
MLPAPPSYRLKTGGTMSKTTAVIIKAEETPWLLTPSERVFVGLDGPGRSPADLHAEALAQGHPCDCPACAPELWRDRPEAGRVG